MPCLWSPVHSIIPVWVLWLPVYVRGTLLWISPAAVGHGPGLGYQLGLHPLTVFAGLNDYAPAWSYLIPGVPSERAKAFSLYISGRCLQKSSDGIWQRACQPWASQSFTRWLCSQHGETATLNILLLFCASCNHLKITAQQDYSFTLNDITLVKQFKFFFHS